MKKSISNFFMYNRKKSLQVQTSSKCPYSNVQKDSKNTVHKILAAIAKLYLFSSRCNNQIKARSDITLYGKSSFLCLICLARLIIKIMM